MKHRNSKWLYREYVTKKKSMKSIACSLKMGETAIHKWIHRFGIPVRSRSVAMTGIRKSKAHKEKLSTWAKQRTGSLNANWKNGKTKLSLLIRGRRFRERRRLVLERDDYECQICGLDIELHIHHKKPVCKYPELVNDLNNLITLCKSCHYRLHSLNKKLANSANSRTDNAELSGESLNV